MVTGSLLGGCFDCLHAGHLYLFKKAIKLSSEIILAINVILSTIPTMLVKMAAQFFIEMIITELVDDEQLAAVLSLLASVAIMMWEVEATFSLDEGFQLTQGTGLKFKSFSDLTP